jgi:hypothetical protein
MWRTATGTHESAKACEELSGLAAGLQRMVSQFRLERNGGLESGEIPLAKRGWKSLRHEMAAIPLK